MVGNIDNIYMEVLIVLLQKYYILKKYIKNTRKILQKIIYNDKMQLLKYEGGKNMKKIVKILPVLVMVCLVFNSVFAINADTLGDAISGGSGAEGITNTAKNIWDTVATIVQILSIAAVVFAGLRYMFASADQKADIKKSMGILAVGALLVFGATTILQLIAGATDVIEK